MYIPWYRSTRVYVQFRKIEISLRFYSTCKFIPLTHPIFRSLTTITIYIRNTRIQIPGMHTINIVRTHIYTAHYAHMLHMNTIGFGFGFGFGFRFCLS